jgi:glycosyltransferase involved in cell wall biosynthesis
MILMIFGGSAMYEGTDGLRTADTFAFFVNSLAAKFSKILYCAPVYHGYWEGSELVEKMSRIAFDSSKVELIETYPSRSLLDFYKRLPCILYRDLRMLKNAVHRADVLFFRIPSVTTIIGLLLALIYGKPFVTYYASDLKKVVLEGRKYSGIRRLFAVPSAYVHHALFRYMTKQAAVAYFLSDEVMSEHRMDNAVFVFTSIVSERDITKRVPQDLKGRAVCLLFVGRLTHEKNLTDILRALAILDTMGVDARLTIVGDGPERKDLINDATNYGVSPRVRFTGFVPQGDELNKFLLNHDIFVMSSISEGSPKVLLEAMAKGLAIVATNVGGIPRLVTDGINGILVPPKSPESIAIAVKRLADNPSLVRTMVAEGYVFVKEHTADQQANRIANAITEKIGDGKRQ